MQIDKPLKIAISIWTFTPNTGGLQTHTEYLCKHLQRRGHNVRVITRSATRVPTYDDYLFFNELQANINVEGVPVRAVRFSRVWSPVLWAILKTAARPAFQEAAARLYEVVSAKPAWSACAGFDIIHHVGHATGLFGFASAQAAGRHRTPFLVQPTAHPFHFGDSNLDFRLYHKADRLLVHTSYERDYFVSRGVNCPVDVVGNGIEDRANGKEERFRAKYNIRGPIVLYLGRRAADKGYSLVIAAFRLIQQKNPNAVLVCMGPRSSDTQIEPAPGVIDIDFVSEDEKHDALAACTCLCIPSVGESFGLVYMEAGRYRKPAIGRNVPVLRELLGRKKAALLIGTPEDRSNSAELNAEELSTGIQRLLDSPALCREIGEECHKISDAFLWPKVVQRFESAYFSTLKTARNVCRAS